MLAISGVSVLFLLVLFFLYRPLLSFAGAGAYVEGKEKQAYEEKTGKMLLIAVFLVGFLIRLVGAIAYRGYEIDINCFLSWADIVYENGFSKFYNLEYFTDYPPGYMYVLYLIGGMRSLFHIEQSSVLSIVITKMPAIIADMVTAWLVYKIALKKFTKKGASLVAGIFLLTPAIILDSAIWAQVDSVFTLFVVLMCYLVTERKLIPSYFAFAIGILVKPQTLIFTPVLLFGIIEQVFLKDFNWNKFWKNLLCGLLAIGVLALLMVPFGFLDAFKQYTETMGSYPYASVNAYNFWTMIGKNWVPQTEKILGVTYQSLGSVCIVLTVLVAAFIHFRNKDTKSKYYFTGVFIVTAMFTLSVRMHERYIYPAIVLLLLCYAVRPRKSTYIGYGILSTVIFLNIAHSMVYFDPNNFDRTATIPIVMSIGMMAAFVYICYLALQTRREYISDEDELSRIREELLMSEKKEKKEEKNCIKKSKTLGKIVKFDLIAMAVITVVYAIVAFVNLGDHKAPETEYSYVDQGETVFDFGQEVQISKIWNFLGNENNPKYFVYSANDLNGIWTENLNVSNPMDAGSVFSWNSTDVEITARYVKIAASPETRIDRIRELVFTDAQGNTLLPVNASEYEALFDEQDMFSGRATNMNGTYFDEIYHARTAYEMIHNLYCYENTHPPLGKAFIACGILMFGMNPFGWRFMGTLFGVLMLPVFYLFAKKLFKESWISVVTTILFAVDFMHFVQTRIATIDVFVTFFIILAYYFMYCFFQTSFYDTKLKKIFVTLGLCGVSMGFSWACKWTGFYASVGLCVLFFANIIQRFREYRYAVKHPEGTTEDISHQYIIENFFPKLIRIIGFCCIFFVVIPVTIYVLSYIPVNDGTGHGLIQRVIESQQSMYNYHSALEATHPYSSAWYEWPVMKRPIWYYSGVVSDTIKEGISAFGNPLVWWAGIPAFAIVLYLAFMTKREKCGFLVISYFSQYLPWVFIGRVVFIYHYFPSVPFVALMVGYCLKLFADWKPKWKMAVYVYAALAVILFAMFYPVLTGTGVSVSYVKHFLKWFNEWVLVQTR